jgi:hypothetical protein
VLLTASKSPFRDWNNSMQFFIIYVTSQQLQGQLLTQHSVVTDNGLEESTGGKS